MRRRVVCPRSHPASPYLRRPFGPFALACSSTRGDPATPRWAACNRCAAWPVAAAPSRLGAPVTSAPVAWGTAAPPQASSRPQPSAERPARGRSPTQPPPAVSGAIRAGIQARAAGGRRPAVHSAPELRTGYCQVRSSERVHNTFLIDSLPYLDSKASHPKNHRNNHALPYSGLLNAAIATPIMASPITATIARDSGIGTGQPSQVTLGESTPIAAGFRDRWLNTAWRIGPTT